ncbi:MAG: DUF2591 domain-containing protein [Pseudomonadota bacterium]|nr:DUF2591 domain-containing protein [Pseudomonadota bacterium]
MPHIAVDELLGDDLNIAVALADGHQVRHSAIKHAPGIHEQWPGGNWEWIRQPSTAWEHGGPIIERERIALEFLDGEWCAWAPGPQRADGGDGSGETPLVAAMRAYVASRFGETVDLESLLDVVSRPGS